MSDSTKSINSLDRHELAQEVALILGGHNLGDKVMIKTFTEVLNLYLKQGNSTNKPKSRKRDECCAVPLLQFFRGWKVSNSSGSKVVNGKKITDYREWRKAAGVSVVSIAREICTASCSINYCITELDWDLNNPFQKRAYSKADRKKVAPDNRVATTEEINLLLKHSEGVFRDLIEFYLETGLRMNEALDMTRDRVFNDIVIMNPDDHKGGYVDGRYLTEYAREILAKQPIVNDYCFTKDDKKVSYWWLRNQWRKLRVKIGSPDLNMKHLRKTCGDMVRKKYSLEVAQAQLGHKNKSTTEKSYAPVSADYVRNALLDETGSSGKEALSTKGNDGVPERGIEPPTYALRMRVLH